MITRRVYRFRLEPTQEQLRWLARYAGTRRWVYNWAVARRTEHFRETGKSLRSLQLWKELHQKKAQPEFLWLCEVLCQTLQQALRDVDAAFEAFFKKNTAFPKFKRKKKGDFSFRVPQRVKLEERRLYCPKIGWIRCRQSREVEGTIKSATFKRDCCGHWFVHLNTEFEVSDEPLSPPQKAVGVDVGFRNLATLSDGMVIAAPKFAKRALAKRKRAQKILSRRKPGSRRFSKARLQLARIVRKTTNQRADFLHKFTTQLVRDFDAICIETVSFLGLAKTKRNVSATIYDAAFGMLRFQFGYKCFWQRKHLGLVPKFFPSSKLCHCCGHLNATLSINDSHWQCVCGRSHQRDINAAHNILAEGLRQLAVGQTESLNARGDRLRPATAGISR